jgi:drug/metabolite transporter (DMT)-like permease
MSQVVRSRSAASGYAMVAGSFLLVGLSGTLVTWATAPVSVLIVLRFAIAACAIASVFGRRRHLAGLRDRALWPRLALMGILDAGALLLYFVAIRETGVAVGTFLFFMQPVWVALLAPRLLGDATGRVVYIAIALALGGLTILLVPVALGDSVSVSPLGLVAGVASGLCFAGFALVTKGLSRRIGSIAMVLTECVLDTLFLLPLALWQVLGAGYSLTLRDLLVAIILGLVVTAVGYTLWMEGIRWVPVQRSAVLGFLTPVAAPVFALVLLGQPVTVWMVAGGALILAAGFLVVLRGQGDLESEPPL